MNTIITRVATSKDMKNIVEVHKKCFPNSFSSLLPSHLLAAYYEEYLNKDGMFVVAEDKDGLLIGFCMGYKVGTTAQSDFLEKNKIQLFKVIIRQLLKFNILAIKSCTKFIQSKIVVFIRSKFGTANVLQSTAAQGELLSICVVDEWKGSSCAYQMLKHFEQILIEHSIKNYDLYVRFNNDRAIHFYEKCGICKDAAMWEKKSQRYTKYDTLRMFKQL